MEDNIKKSKRIIRNTILMYVRMFVTMGIGLYTSRIVLKALGVEDFGIFNVVGGLVTLFTFINTAMLASTQRFLNFEIGRNDISALNQVFKTSYIIHIFIAIGIVVIGEPLGMFFLDYKLQIPESRYFAAFVVFQVSIAICVIQVLAMPFNSDIIAHEKFDVYAYISIIEYALKLGMAFLIRESHYDRLIEYVILLGVIQLLVATINIVYCWKHFDEVKGKLKICRNRLQEMGKFASWCLVGCTAGAFAGQGLNILLGIFFDPVINAARGIAVQVQAAIMTFGSNLNTAMTPQITQSYASGDHDFFFNILYRGSKYVFFLIALISVPVMLRTEYIIELWLGEVPEYTVPFLRWLICATLIETISTPLMRASDASGRIKMYHSVVGGILLLILPISYVVLRFGGTPVSVFIVYFCINLVAWAARLVILRSTIKLSVRKYCIAVFFKISFIFAVANIAGYYATLMIPQNFGGLILVCLISSVITVTLIYFFGLDQSERNFVNNKINKIISRF